MAVKLTHGLLILTCLVELGYLLKDKVITLSHQLRIALQHGKALSMWFLQAFVQLVKFHQHTGIGLIQVECLLHVFQSLRLTILLVEACQGKITPHGRELRIKAC